MTINRFSLTMYTSPFNVAWSPLNCQYIYNFHLHVFAMLFFTQLITLQKPVEPLDIDDSYPDGNDGIEMFTKMCYNEIM